MARKMNTIPFVKARVSIDGARGSFKAYLAPGRWNGFEQPYFPYDEGLRLAKALAAGGPNNVKLTYWPSKGCFVERWDGQAIPYYSQKVLTVDGVKTLHPIGAGVWTWTISKKSW